MTEADREAPVWRSTILWIGFLILVVVAIFTVLIPELQSDSDPDSEETSSAEED